MKPSIQRAVAAIGIAVGTMLAASASANHPPASPMLGTPIHGDSFDRVVRIDAGTKWANVTANETVKFVLTGAQGGERSFVWKFDSGSRTMISLNEIAPDGIAAGRSIQVYVSPDPNVVP